MADLTVTATSVVPSTTTGVLKSVTAGETITAGMPVYKDTSTSKYKKAVTTDVNTSAVEGVACCGSALNQPLVILTSGDLAMGTILTAGTTYAISDTAGGLCPIADNGTGDFPCIIGVATSTSNLNVKIHAAGVAKS